MRAAVVGGSLGGLTAALALRRAGWEVEVYERSRSSLAATGAGIIVHPVTSSTIADLTGASLDAFSLGVGTVRTLDQTGSLLLEDARSYRTAAWSSLYRPLRDCFGERGYHGGASVSGAEQDADGVTLSLVDGRRVRCELAVFADGILSTGRALLIGELPMPYAGYVGWRGTAGFDDLGADAYATLSGAVTFGLAPASHIVAYPIPSAGARPLVNYVFYRNETAIDALMTTQAGERRAVSLRPGEVQPRFVDALRETARASLAPILAELVVATDRPFVQQIVDVATPRMVVGRSCLIGDAAFAGRPHAAAGTAKALDDARTLARAVEACDGDVAGALARWEPARLQLGRTLVARVRAMGERSQVTGTWDPRDPSLRFGLYEAGDC